jgi:hypothetical protein
MMFGHRSADSKFPSVAILKISPILPMLIFLFMTSGSKGPRFAGSRKTNDTDYFDSKELCLI